VGTITNLQQCQKCIHACMYTSLLRSPENTGLLAASVCHVCVWNAQAHARMQLQINLEAQWPSLSFSAGRSESARRPSENQPRFSFLKSAPIVLYASRPLDSLQGCGFKNQRAAVQTAFSGVRGKYHRDLEQSRCRS
jgi:hypothetical protein